MIIMEPLRLKLKVINCSVDLLEKKLYSALAAGCCREVNLIEEYFAGSGTRVPASWQRRYWFINTVK